MKTKLKIFGIVVVFISVLLFAGAVSASDDNIGNDTVKITELETTDTLNANEGDVHLESTDNDVATQEESSQTPEIAKTNDEKLSNSTDTTNTTATKQEGKITSSNFKTEYQSGKSFKVTVTDKTTGNGIKTSIKVQFIKNGKVIKESIYSTSASGVANIAPNLDVGKYTVKISSNDDNVTAQTISKTVTIVKTTTKVTAKKVTAYKGYKITLKAVLGKTKSGKKVNEGKVRFKVNGKTYTVKVKNGVATKKIKLSKAKTYKYTAQYLGNANIKKSKVATGKAIVKNRYDVKITVSNMKGTSGETRKYQILVTTASGKKVTSGQIKLTWNGKTIYCNVTNGVVKLVGTFGANFKEQKDGNNYYYKQYTTTFKVKYIPSSLKYKEASTKYKMTSTYKCAACGKTATHAHITDGKTTWIYVV